MVFLVRIQSGQAFVSTQSNLYQTEIMNYEVFPHEKLKTGCMQKKEKNNWILNK